MITNEGNCSATFYVTPYSSAQLFKTFTTARVTCRELDESNPRTDTTSCKIRFNIIHLVSFLILSFQ